MDLSFPPFPSTQNLRMILKRQNNLQHIILIIKTAHVSSQRWLRYSPACKGLWGRMRHKDQPLRCWRINVEFTTGCARMAGRDSQVPAPSWGLHLRAWAGMNQRIRQGKDFWVIGNRMYKGTEEGENCLGWGVLWNFEGQVGSKPFCGLGITHCIRS